MKKTETIEWERLGAIDEFSRDLRALLRRHAVVLEDNGRWLINGEYSECWEFVCDAGWKLGIEAFEG